MSQKKNEKKREKKPSIIQLKGQYHHDQQGMESEC